MFRTGKETSVDATRLISSLACIGALAFAASPPSAMPLSFEVNRRQAPSGVRFLSRGRGYYLELRDTSFALGLNVPQGGLSRLEMKLSGAHPERMDAGRPLPGVVNYYLGQDPEKWISGVPTYESVRYKRAYEGIDVVFYGREGKLEYDFVVAPAADPARIRLKFSGADSLAIENGDLMMRTKAGLIRQHRPELYQIIDGSKRLVAGEYILTASNEVALRVGAYDPRRELTIDPVLAYSTYSGGAGDHRGNGVAVDSAGNASIVGTTNTGFADANAFVQKINPAGTAIAYTSYVGSDCTDDGRGIAVDANGNAYITGLLTLRDQWGYCNNKEAFVAKLDGTGTQVYGTYFGSNDDHGNAITVDSAGNAWVTGLTNGNFPVTNGSSGGFPGDAFILELDAAGKNILYATYVGGGSIDEGNAIALDKNGNVWIAGSMQSCDFAAVNGFNTKCAGGGVDGFLAGVNPKTNQLCTPPSSAALTATPQLALL